MVSVTLGNGLGLLSSWKPPVSGFGEKARELGVDRAWRGPWHDIIQLSLAQPESQTESGIRGSLPSHLCLLCAAVLLESAAGKWYIVHACCLQLRLCLQAVLIQHIGLLKHC